MRTAALAVSALIMLPAFGYMMLLTYLLGAGQIEQNASLFGTFAVLVGVLTVGGLGMARFCLITGWKHREPICIFLGVGFACLSALSLIMQRIGLLSEPFLGRFLGYSDTGYVLGVIAGAGLFVCLVLAERDIGTSPRPPRKS